ncbi:AraC-like DNA-binding protein [Sphingomonas insulae]|uniref:helix-turn-helix domain-containing protein n=1 Tax=Sphingomonas insulae TaxID=424800 RepID=UPI003B849251|nr:AraC-like DNA-binding protein [Sphingomonas insulae]
MKHAHESIAHAPPPAGSPPTLAWTRIFASDALPEGERYRCWRDADIAGYAKRFDTRPVEPFAVTMDRIDLGPLSVGGSQFSAQEWSRERSNIVADGCDHIVVNVRHRGAARGDMAGRIVAAPAGSIVLADMAQIGRHASEASVTSGFALPRAVAEQMLPSVRSLHGHVVAPEQAALLVSHMAMIRQHADRLPASSGPLLARTIVDLLTMAVCASVGGVPADGGQHERGLRHQLCAAIEQHLGSPSLNTVRLSRMIGVSRSTLYRLLQDEGGVQAYIRTRRLARVATALRDGDRDTIAALAERWGFCDAAYLGRAFREVYGLTPGDYRALHGIPRP